jgi:hypothetical protein
MRRHFVRPSFSSSRRMRRSARREASDSRPNVGIRLFFHQKREARAEPFNAFPGAVIADFFSDFRHESGRCSNLNSDSGTSAKGQPAYPARQWECCARSAPGSAGSRRSHCRSIVPPNACAASKVEPPPPNGSSTISPGPRRNLYAATREILSTMVACGNWKAHRMRLNVFGSPFVK